MDATKIFSTLFKLAVVSFVVGLVLSFFDIDPAAVFENFGATVQKIFELARDAVEWSAKYIVIGAVIVVPIWLIAMLLGALKNRNKRDG